MKIPLQLEIKLSLVVTITTNVTEDGESVVDRVLDDPEIQQQEAVRCHPCLGRSRTQKRKELMIQVFINHLKNSVLEKVPIEIVVTLALVVLLVVLL